MMKKTYQADALYFPQSFCAGIFISFISIGYMGITCLRILGQFKTEVHKMYTNVYDVMFSFFRNGNMQMINLMKIELDSNMMMPFTAKLTDI